MLQGLLSAVGSAAEGVLTAVSVVVVLFWIVLLFWTSVLASAWAVHAIYQLSCGRDEEEKEGRR